MRSQLVRRTQDLKKNIAGAARFLEILREMSSVVSEIKMFYVNEALELNTKNLCVLQVRPQSTARRVAVVSHSASLSTPSHTRSPRLCDVTWVAQEANERAATSLQILQMIFAGILAFDILDRLTGDWTVVNTAWAQAFVSSMIQNTPAMWFVVSLAFWGILAFCLYRFFRHLAYQAQGVTTVRLKVDRKIFLDKLRLLLSTKRHSFEERDYDDALSVIKITYDEVDAKEWGGHAPRIMLEYDEKNRVLYSLTVTYNRRLADKVRSWGLVAGVRSPAHHSSSPHADDDED
jgi:WD repeat-containing protein 35